MATRTISTKLAIEGESEYRTAISNINSELSTLKTKVQLVDSEFANHRNSLEALQAKSEVLAEQQAKLTEKVNTCKEAYANAQTALQNYQTRTESLQSALNQNKTALESLSTETRNAGEKWNAYQSQVEQAEAKLKLLQSTTGDTSEEEAKLKSQIDTAKAAMAQLDDETGGMASTAAGLLTEQKNLNSELQKSEAGAAAAATACNKWEASTNTAQIQLNKTNAEIELNEQYLQEAASSADHCATSIDEFGNKVKTADTNTGSMKETLEGLQNMLLTQMLMNAFKKLTSALEECIDAASEFESQMSTVKALSGATADEMESLTAAAKTMGSTTVYTATEAGEALEYMALAGWDTDEMLDGLSGVMNLAAASGTDLATTSDIVTDALTAFGYSASDSAHFADVLAQSSANSNTNVSQLGEAFQNVGTTAGALGYSVDDVSVALGLMANNGIKGATAGTQLATALTRMSGANDNAVAEMDALGVSMYDVNGAAKPLGEYLSELRTALAENCTSTRDLNLAAYELAGQKGMKGLLAIVNSSDEEFEALTASIDNCSGAAEEMAGIKLDNYAGQITLLQSAMDALETTIGEQLTPTLGNLAEFATGLINNINDFIENNPSVVSAMSGMTVALGLMAGALTVATVAGKAYDAVLSAIEKHPVLMAVSAITAAVAAVAAFVTVMKSYNDSLDTAKNRSRELKTEVEGVVSAYEDSKSAVQENKTSLDNLLTTYEELISKADRSAAEQVVLLDVIDQLNSAIPGLNLAYDEETNSINLTTEAVKNLADAQNVNEEYQAAVEAMPDLYAAQADAAAELEQAQRELEAAQAANTDAGLQWIDTGTQMIAVQSDSALQVAELTAAVQADQEAYDAVTAQIEEASETIERYNETTEEAANTTDTQIKTAVENLAEKLIDLKQNYDDVYSSAYDSMNGQFELWEKADDVVTTSFEDMMDALQKQQQYWEDYTDNLDNLKNRQIDGINEMIDAYGDDVEAVASMAALNDEQLQIMVNQWQTTNDAMSAAADDYADTITGYSTATEDVISDCITAILNLDQSEEARQLAYNTLAAYVSGIDEESDEADAAMLMVADDILQLFQDELDMHSPSRKFENFGENTIIGYINGIDNQKASLDGKMLQTAQDAISQFTSGSNGSTLTSSGSATISGYLSGITGSQSSLNSTMLQTAQGAILQFKNTGTDSALLSTGQSTISGYVSGVSAKQASLYTKMADTAAAALQKFKDNCSSDSFNSAGGNVLQGFINGLTSKSSTLYSKMKSIAQSALSAFNKALGVNSPSRYTKQTGVYAGEGYIEGVDSMRGKVGTAMERLAESAEDGFNPVLSYDLDALDQKITAAKLVGSRGGISGGSTDQTLGQIRDALEKLQLGNFSQTNNYYTQVATPSEVAKAQRETAQKLLGGVA